MQRPDETWHRLREWTYGQPPSERLAAQILLASGFENIDPIHPLGGRDGGKDAICEKDGARWAMAVYFPRGQMDFKDISNKFIGDLAGAKKNKASGIAFVTNQELTDGERKKLAALGDKAPPTISVELFHLERIVTLLDSSSLATVREQYLYIPAVPNTKSLDKKLFEEFLDIFSSNGEALRLLKEQDLGATFPSEGLNILDAVNRSWRDAAHEFIDDEVDSQRNKFLDALSAFLKEIACHADEGNTRGFLNIGMDDYETRQDMFDLRDKLNHMATSVYNEQQALVRIGRRRIA